MGWVITRTRRIDLPGAPWQVTAESDGREFHALEEITTATGRKIPIHAASDEQIVTWVEGWRAYQAKRAR